MTNVAVVVDNAPAGRLVERVLGDPRVQIVNGGERSGAMMTATSILFREGWKPTVLLLDADSLEERAITEQQLETGGYLRRGSAGHPHRLVLAIPQVESVLFTDPAGLEAALGKKVTDEQAFEARFRPKAVFYRLLGRKKDAEKCALTVIDRLDEDALARMACHPVIREIREFVEHVQPRPLLRGISDPPGRWRRARKQKLRHAS